MPKHKNNRKAPRNGPRRKKGRNHGGPRPTLILHGHALIQQTLTGVNVKQVNIIPTLSIFQPDVLAQAKNFQQYRISRVNVKFFATTNASYQQALQPLELPVVYHVPLRNQTVPLPAISSYLSYKSVRYHTFKNDMSKSFAPVCPAVVGMENKAQWVRSPRTSTTNLDLPHYGHSFLFVKPLNFTNVITLTAVITANIQFYTYSGNNAVASSFQHFDLAHNNARLYEHKIFRQQDIPKSQSQSSDQESDELLVSQDNQIQLLAQRQVEKPPRRRQQMRMQDQRPRIDQLDHLGPKQRNLILTLLARAGIEKNPGPNQFEHMYFMLESLASISLQTPIAQIPLIVKSTKKSKKGKTGAATQSVKSRLIEQTNSAIEVATINCSVVSGGSGILSSFLSFFGFRL